ncbi:unnamed protein product [Strongylus vulgaris]|uniref:Uncharacterized protein n=1 Tax=Strongylus vulgaris TaxID=40348 RepID=A0A3P7LLR3_STRVU|nr:unnamed protein product [Strongylus vulgaris]
MTLGVELRCIAEVYPPAGSPELEDVRRFRFPGCPAKSRLCRKHHRLADSVARWLPDSCGESLAGPWQGTVNV